MICKYCGADNDSRSKFCKNCGSQWPNEQEIEQDTANIIVPKKRWGLKLYGVTMTIVCVLLLGFSFGTNFNKLNSSANLDEAVVSPLTSSSEIDEKNLSTPLLETITDSVNKDSILNIREKQFSTPEEAIYYYVDALAKNDLIRALEATIINKVDRIDSAKAVKRYGMYMPSLYRPNQYQTYQMYNQLKYANEITNNMFALTASLLQPEWESDISYHYIENVENEKYIDRESETIYNINAFFESLDPAKLRSLKIVQIRDDYIPDDLRERLKEQDKQTSSYYGALDVKEYTVLYEWNGQYYCGGFTMMKYADGWKVSYPSANFWGTSYMGDLEEITPDEFERKIVETRQR